MSSARSRRKGADAAAAAPTSAASAASGAGDSLKDSGNRCFVAQDYPRALEFFSAAIDCLVEASDAGLAAAAAKAGVEPSQLHLLYSNRSATHAAMRQWQQALDDADRCVQLQSSWAKGHFRRGVALEGLLHFTEAADAYAAGLAVDPSDAALRRCSEDIAALLKELKLTESQLSKSANPDADRFERMVRWMKEGGSKFPRLYLQYYSEDYRGVHCLSRIPADEIILYVPYHMVMTSQVAMESPIGQTAGAEEYQLCKAMVDAQLDLRSKHSYLAAYLLQERAKGVDSFWAPYIASLPQSYASMPIHFGPDLLKQLQGSMCLAKIQDRIDSLKAEYDNICAHVPAMKQFSHEDFVWARLAVITRIFGLVIRGMKTDGLVAYADMLNHKRPRDAADTDTRWTFDDALNGFTITTTRQIERGEQVFDSYGRKCNSRFFVNYGFALDDNEEDNEALLRISLAAGDIPCLAAKTRLAAGKNILAIKEFQVPASYRETSDREKKGRELFSWLRFLHATDQELMQIQAIQAEQGYGVTASDGTERPLKLDGIDPISTRLESVVVNHVARAAKEALAAFPTTLEEDNLMLAAASFPNSNVRNCVVQRRGEKQVLRWWIDLAAVCTPLLAMNWADLRKLAPKHMSNSPRDFYITHCVATIVKRGA